LPSENIKSVHFKIVGQNDVFILVGGSGIIYCKEKEVAELSQNAREEIRSKAYEYMLQKAQIKKSL